MNRSGSAISSDVRTSITVSRRPTPGIAPADVPAVTGAAENVLRTSRSSNACAMGIPSGVGSRGDRQRNPGGAPSTLLPPLRLVEPIPVGDATELPGAVVRVLPDRHGWDAWDVATMAMDFDPLQPLGEA